MEDKKAIENLLLDIDILNDLDKWTKDINIFEVSGMKHQEIKHSNTLAWFFDSNESHNLDDEFIRRFIQKVISFNLNVTSNFNIFDASLIDYHSFRVYREWKNIDIVIESKLEKIVIVIENKVYSSEGKDQLNNYKNTIDREFPNYTKVFIYLTGEGEKPSDEQNWLIASYKMVIESLNDIINATTTISNKVKIIIDDYISIVRRVFGMDQELKEVINKLYYKHKRAFDLIIEVAANSHEQVSDYIKHWLKDHKAEYGLNLVEENSTTSFIRFTSNYIDELFPYDNDKTDSWKSGYSLFYEIHIMRDKGAYLVGTLGNSEREHSKTLTNLIKWDKKSFQYKRVLGAKNVIRDEIQEGLTEEVKEKINNNLHKIAKNHILPFENKIRKFIEEEND